VGKACEMLAPLSYQERVRRNENQQAKQGQKKPWHWDSIHQIAFDNVKSTIAKEVVLAYPCFLKPFEIYTDHKNHTRDGLGRE